MYVSFAKAGNYDHQIRVLPEQLKKKVSQIGERKK